MFDHRNFRIQTVRVGPMDAELYFLKKEYLLGN